MNSGFSNFIADSLGKLIIVSYYIVPSSTMVRDDLVANISLESNFVRNFYNDNMRFTILTKKVNLDISQGATLTESDYVNGTLIGIIS